jgi:hypothetical protein
VAFILAVHTDQLLYTVYTRLKCLSYLSGLPGEIVVFTLAAFEPSKAALPAFFGISFDVTLAGSRHGMRGRNWQMP